MTVLNDNRKRNLTIARLNVIKALNNLISRTSQPRLRALYSAVKQNVLLLPINFRGGGTLASDGRYSTMGENVKRIGPNGELQSAVFLPVEHVFDGNRLSYDGLMTLLHEYSHVTLEPHARMFANSLGLAGELSDEFFADTVSAKIAREMSVPREIIVNHYRPRASLYGMDIARLIREGATKEFVRSRKPIREEPRMGPRREEPSFFPIRSEHKLFNFEPRREGLFPVRPRRRGLFPI